MSNLTDPNDEIFRQILELDKVGKTRHKLLLSARDVYTLSGMSQFSHAISGAKIYGMEVVVISDVDSFAFPKVVALEDVDNLAYIAWWEKHGKTQSKE